MSFEELKIGDTDAFEAIDKLINEVKEMELKPLHILFNSSNPSISVLLEAISENEIGIDGFKNISGVPVSFLQFGLEELFLILLTDDPLKSSAILTNPLYDNPDTIKSDYVM